MGSSSYPEKGVFEKNVLPGEIEGIETRYQAIRMGASCLAGAEERLRIYFFFKGEGFVQSGDTQFAVSGVALFIPAFSDQVTLSAQDNDLEIISIRMYLSKGDRAYMDGQSGKFPYFVSFAESRPYREDIKSERTVNRMFLPENIVPRFSAGSVETTGPDEVGMHAHPVLEQLFFGLEGNACLVTADEQEESFEENVLLRIPSASQHGVRVEEGKALRYVWMDFFRSQEDMGYMDSHHILEE
jgi:mannose-6-phosphate isomerase-like protein (cupin superfamily)